MLDGLQGHRFTALALSLIAVAAYFGAKGATDLAAAALCGNDTPVAPSNAERGIEKTKSDRTTTLIERNPFDTETRIDTQAYTSSDPLGAPECDRVSAEIVTESDDASWSVATLRGWSEAGPVMRRTGDAMGGRRVVFIGFNPKLTKPSVWMVDGSGLCQTVLFAGRSVTRSTEVARLDGNAQASSDLGIVRASDTEFRIARARIDDWLQRSDTLAKAIRIVPEIRGGTIVGVRLFGIRPNTLFVGLGLENGDRLDAVDGIPMVSTADALRAYARLRTAPRLTIQLTRQGRPLSLNYEIQ